MEWTPPPKAAEVSALPPSGPVSAPRSGATGSGGGFNKLDMAVPLELLFVTLRLLPPRGVEPESPSPPENVLPPLLFRAAAAPPPPPAPPPFPAPSPRPYSTPRQLSSMWPWKAWSRMARKTPRVSSESEPAWWTAPMRLTAKWSASVLRPPYRASFGVLASRTVMRCFMSTSRGKNILTHSKKSISRAGSCAAVSALRR
mmetsp:Transcript_5773/g.14006  ORF Transcript_5773/g.14006 Transcript_5773/m.14006 type:complete len:200 (+) Transcript_5773:182-781(+)